MYCSRTCDAIEASHSRVVGVSRTYCGAMRIFLQRHVYLQIRTCMRSRQTADTRVPMLCNQGKVPVSGRHDYSCKNDQWGRAAGVLTLNPDFRVNWFVWFVLTSVLCPKSPPLNCLVSVCFTTLKLGLKTSHPSSRTSSYHPPYCTACTYTLAQYPSIHIEPTASPT